MKLSDFNHLKDLNSLQFKEEIVGGVEVVIPCYMISDDKLWNSDLGLETRGHVFRKDSGECISLAFNKFFNLNEKENTQEHNLDFSNMSIAEKCDGSMITCALVDDNIYFKTKKSFYSDVAKLANVYASAHVKEFSKYCLFNGLSPIWEFTHPEWKIVIDYGNVPTWTLLAIRQIETGKYLKLDSIKDSIVGLDFTVAKNYHFNSIEELKLSLENMSNQEGYVITLSSGKIIKTKCNWYNLRHHLNTDLRERDVAKMCSDETLDDIKSTAIESGYDIKIILDIENRFISEMKSIIYEVNNLVNLIKLEETRKDAAIKYSKLNFFGMAITLINGKDPDYKKYWNKNFLYNYSLRTVYSDFNNVEKEKNILL